MMNIKFFLLSVMIMIPAHMLAGGTTELDPLDADSAVRDHGDANGSVNTPTSPLRRSLRTIPVATIATGNIRERISLGGTYASSPLTPLAPARDGGTSTASFVPTDFSHLDNKRLSLLEPTPQSQTDQITSLQNALGMQNTAQSVSSTTLVSKPAIPSIGRFVQIKTMLLAGSLVTTATLLYRYFSTKRKHRTKQRTMNDSDSESK